MYCVSCSVESLSATPWTVTHQAPLSMEFSRQEYWSGLSFPSPGDLPNPGIKPASPALWADSLPSELPSLRLCSLVQTLHYLPPPLLYNDMDILLILLWWEVQKVLVSA